MKPRDRQVHRLAVRLRIAAVAFARQHEWPGAGDATHDRAGRKVWLRLARAADRFAETKAVRS